LTAPVAVVNLKAANGATGRHWPRLAKLMGSALGQFTTVFTASCGDGTRLAQEAIEQGAELVISVGGDGTHNEVLNGLFDGDKLRNPASRLAVVPAGTGGDLRRSLGLPESQRDVIARLGEGRRRVDVGRLEFTADDGSPGTRLFLNVSSCGVSGKVVEVVNSSGKWLGGRLSFAIGSARALAGYRDQRIRLRLDGGDPRELSVTALAVANGQYFGGGMRVAPAAEMDDGLFDVTIWKGFTLADFILKSSSLYSGSHLRLPGAESHRATRVEAEPISSDKVVLIDLDGERPGRLPAAWQVLPAALWLQGAHVR
jgi:YegS/Rv2252/BmrU family lipid kinase